MQAFYDEDQWNISIIETPKNIDIDQEVLEKEIVVLQKLEQISQDFMKNFKNFKGPHQQFPKFILNDFLKDLSKFTQQNFQKFIDDNIVFCKEIKNNLSIESIRKHGRVFFPSKIGEGLTVLFCKSDFLGLSWVLFEIIIQTIENLFSEKHKEHINGHVMYKLSQRLETLPYVVNILKILALLKNNNIFAFNYCFLKLLGYFISIEPFSFSSQMFDLYQQRLERISFLLCVPLQAILSLPDWNKEFKEIISLVWKIFPKLDFGSYYFLAWKKIIFENTSVFCKINNPFKQDLFIEDLDQTQEELDNFLTSFLPENIYGFDVGAPKDIGITLPNKNIGFKLKHIDVSLKSKVFLLNAGIHEFGHAKGIISYKQGDYFQNSPQSLGNEAGFNAQDGCFGRYDEFEMTQNETLYGYILSSIIVSKEKITPLLKKEQLMKNEIEKAQDNQLNGGIAKKYEDLEEYVCGYTLSRDAIIRGFLKTQFN